MSRIENIRSLANKLTNIYKMGGGKIYTPTLLFL